MKTFKNYIALLLVITVIMSLFIIPTVSASAKTATTTFLKNNKTYSFNLDKKGKSEEVRFEQTKNEEEYTTYYKSDLFIQGKKVFSANDTMKVKAVVADTDKSDKQLEVLIIQGYWSDNPQEWSEIKHIYYYKYSNGKTKKVQDIYSLIKSKFDKFTDVHSASDKLITVDGKGKLLNKVCIRLASYKNGNGMDFIHIKNNVKLVSGKYVNTKDKSYKLYNEGFNNKETVHVSKVKNKVYKKPGGSKVAYTLKKNDTFTIKSYYRKSKTSVYLEIKNKKGKTGYINPKTFSEKQTGSLHVGC